MKTSRGTKGPADGRDHKAAEERRTRAKIAKDHGVGVKTVRIADLLEE